MASMVLSSQAFQAMQLFGGNQHQHVSPRVEASRKGRTTAYSSGGGFGKDTEVSKINDKKPSLSSPAGDFAYQEMLVLLRAMQKQGATSRTMDPAKRSELEGYVRTVLENNRHKSLPLKDIGRALVPSSEWKLMFSSSEAVLESLPNDATVFLNVKDEEHLDYILKFSKKTLGLESLTAECTYTFDVSFDNSFHLNLKYEHLTS